MLRRVSLHKSQVEETSPHTLEKWIALSPLTCLVYSAVDMWRFDGGSHEVDRNQVRRLQPAVCLNPIQKEPCKIYDEPFQPGLNRSPGLFNPGWNFTLPLDLALRSQTWPSCKCVTSLYMHAGLNSTQVDNPRVNMQCCKTESLLLLLSVTFFKFYTRYIYKYGEIFFFLEAISLLLTWVTMATCLCTLQLRYSVFIGCSIAQQENYWQNCFTCTSVDISSVQRTSSIDRAWFSFTGAPNR